MAKKNKLWVEYKKSLDSITTAKKKASTAFNNLFQINSEVQYQRKTNGPIYTGHILRTSPDNLRLYIANRRTGATYWIESFWIVEST